MLGAQGSTAKGSLPTGKQEGKSYRLWGRTEIHREKAASLTQTIKISKKEQDSPVLTATSTQTGRLHLCCPNTQPPRSSAFPTSWIYSSAKGITTFATCLFPNNRLGCYPKKENRILPHSSACHRGWELGVSWLGTALVQGAQQLHRVCRAALHIQNTSREHVGTKPAWSFRYTGIFCTFKMKKRLIWEQVRQTPTKQHPPVQQPSLRNLLFRMRCDGWSVFRHESNVPTRLPIHLFLTSLHKNSFTECIFKWTSLKELPRQ